jgi:RNA 2',3'-cyclic 3'-phosphodiesterase
LRLFVAARLPEELRSSLASAILPVAREARSLSPVRPEAMHVTLRFVGETEPARVEELRALLRDARLGTPAFRATLGGYGRFPPRGQPRVLYVGFRSGEEGFQSLWREVAALTRGFGDGEPESSFVPHVTLARNRRGDLSPELPSLRSLVGFLDGLSVELRVQAASLFESVLERGGPRHTLLEEVRCAQ